MKGRRAIAMAAILASSVSVSGCKTVETVKNAAGAVVSFLKTNDTPTDPQGRNAEVQCAIKVDLPVTGTDHISRSIYRPLDPYARLFPTFWYSACVLPTSSTGPFLPVLKTTGALNIFGSTPVLLFRVLTPPQAVSGAGVGTWYLTTSLLPAGAISQTVFDRAFIRAYR